MDEEKFAKFTNLDELYLYDNGQTRLGEYQYLASSIKINTTRADYQKQYEAFTQSLDIGVHIRASFHELVHSFQYHTTPFGFYLSLLSEFQILQLRHLVLCIQEVMPVTYPLLPLILKRLQPVQKFKKVWFHLKYWYLAELVRLYFIGDFNNFAYYYNQSIFRDSLPSDWLYELEKEMCKVLNLPQVMRAIPDQDTEVKAMIHDINLRVMSSSDTLSVLENQARVSEYWWETGYRSNPFGPVSNKVGYSGLIAEYTAMSNAENFQQFTETFYAICELALFSPILPVNHGKEYSLSIRQLNPIVRVREIMAAAQTTAPVRDLDDHRRFLDEVSYKLQYPPLALLLEDAQFLCSKSSGSYDSNSFLMAQCLRKQDFSIFYNLGRWHPLSKYSYGDAPAFTAFFIPPIVQFSDKTLFFQDASIVQGLFERHLTYNYLKELLIGFQRNENHGNAVPVKSPYLTDGDDLEHLQEFCAEKLKACLGKEIPQAKVF